MNTIRLKLKLMPKRRLRTKLTKLPDLLLEKLLIVKSRELKAHILKRKQLNKRILRTKPKMQRRNC
jgi:hypothetical protein